MADINDKCNDGCDMMPNIYEGLKCYPFQIESKKLQAAQQTTGASFFGGLFKKLTN